MKWALYFYNHIQLQVTWFRFASMSIRWNLFWTWIKSGKHNENSSLLPNIEDFLQFQWQKIAFRCIKIVIVVFYMYLINVRLTRIHLTTRKLFAKIYTFIKQMMLIYRSLSLARFIHLLVLFFGHVVNVILNEI